MSTSPTTQITLRASTAADQAEIARLATIDSRSAPTGRLLLAEVDGQLRAALAIEDGVVIADPFAPTSALVDLLRTQSPTPRHKRHRRGVRRFALTARPQTGNS